MEKTSTQQIEEELRRALKLNQDQPPPSNARQSKSSPSLLASASSSSADAQLTHKGSSRVSSSPQNAATSPSCAGVSDKLATASLSSPSITNSAQASCVSGARSGRHHKPGCSKHNHAQHMPHDAVVGSGSRKNMSESQKSAGQSGGKVSHQRGGKASRGRGIMGMSGSSRDSTAAAAVTSSAFVVGCIHSTMRVMNSSSYVRAATDTVAGQSGGKVSHQRGGKASQGCGIMAMSAMPHQTDQVAGTASRGRGVKKHMGTPTVPVQLPPQKPLMTDDDHADGWWSGGDLAHDVTKHEAALSGQLLGAGNNINVKSAPLPRANEHVVDLSSNEADAKIAQNSNKQPVHKHKKDGDCADANKDHLPNNEELQRINDELEAEYVFALKKKSTKIPAAKYFCRLCDYHCMSVEHCHRHIKDQRHVRLLSMKAQDEFIRTLPAPTELHVAAVSQAISSLMPHIAAADVSYVHRMDICKRLQDVAYGVSRDACVYPYGSSVSNFALVDSDLNIDVEVGEPAKFLSDLLEVLRHDTTGYFTDVAADFQSKMPVIRVIAHHDGHSYRLEIVVSNAECVETSQLLGVYSQLDPRVRPLVITFRYWAKMCSIDKQLEGTLPAYVFSLLAIYYLQQCSPPVLPVLHELKLELFDTYIWPVRTSQVCKTMLTDDQKKKAQLMREANPDMIYLNDVDFLQVRWQCDNTESIGRLWIGLLRFWCVGFDTAESVVCIRQKALLTHSDKKWMSKKLTIEDPFSRRRPVSRSVSHGRMFEFIDERLRVAYCYFATLPSQRADIKQQSSSNAQPPQKPLMTDDDHANGWWSGGDLAHDDVTRHEAALSDQECHKTNELQESVPEPVQASDYEFTESVLADKKGPAIICSTCQKEGHLKRNCPDNQLPPLPSMPRPSKQHMRMLNDFLTYVPVDFMPTDQEVCNRQYVLNELLGIIRKTYPDARLCLFGSSCNGFGFRNSDLDITLTFKGRETDEGLNNVEIIEKLASTLKKHKSVVYNILPITTAKVPIVKFKHARTQLEGDISLYNTLAQHNTRMLQTYADIDERVRTLGYIMKVFAKCADICDASRGTLSSYAYTLMVIYFLQQRTPPVVPVLQELYTGPNRPVRQVDKWNAWFFEDLNALPRMWSGLCKNKESIADLWLGLLRFYTEEFPFNERVVCIRRLAPLSKFEKLWNGCRIAVEDPFDLNHNLGSGLSQKMSVYIQKVFRNARLLFGTSLREIPRGFETVADYFFSYNLLTSGLSQPNDRGCRRCGKIGHFVNECPLLAGKGRKREKEPLKSNADKEGSNEGKISSPKNNVLAKSPPCSSSDTNSAGSSSWHQVPLKASSSDSSSAAASVVFCNSSSVPVTPSSDTQVLPVYLLQPGAVSVPVPLLYGGPCVRPAAIASQSLPIMHSPWLAASPAGMQDQPVFMKYSGV